MRLAPIRVLAAWRPASKARFFPVEKGQNVRFLQAEVHFPGGGEGPGEALIRAFDWLYGIWYSRTVVGALGAGSGTLVTGVAGDTHDCGFCTARERRLANCLVVSRGGTGRRHHSKEPQKPARTSSRKFQW